MVITWSDLLRWSFGKKKQTPTFGEERPILPYPPERMVGVWTVRGGWSMSCRTEHTNIDQWDTSLDVGCARGTGNLPQKKRIGQDIARSNFVTSDLYPQNKCNKPSTTTTTSPAAVYFFYHYFVITSKFEELAHPICFAMWFQIKTLVFTCIITFNNRLTTHQVQFRLESTAGFNDPFFFAFLCNWVTCISQGLTCLTFQICELLRVTKCQLNWCGEH